MKVSIFFKYFTIIFIAFLLFQYVNIRVDYKSILEYRLALLKDQRDTKKTESLSDLIQQNQFSEKELIDVLKKAQIYDDIKKLEFGLDSEIGENGIKLSGGQKQRVAIARLLLMDSKVIVFDEATSALDNSSQNKIVEMLERYKDQKTIIIVAHRLSTIVNADKIYMLDDGKVIANGTHKQLMKNCKEYYNLYKLEEENAKEEN